MNKISPLTNQILDLWADGLPAKEVAERCGTTHHYVRDVAAKARARGDERANARYFANISLKLSYAMRRALDAKARQRGITPAELTNEILLRIVNDDLFDAVLDDGE